VSAQPNGRAASADAEQKLPEIGICDPEFFADAGKSGQTSEPPAPARAFARSS
jgi:hypothetical protein